MACKKYEKWLTKESLILIQGWARDGLSEEQIAHNMGISRNTLFFWRQKFPEVAEALAKGREIIDYEVENALVKRALGYKVKERTWEKVWNPELEKYININTKTVEKEIAPDIGAICFYLKNRKPDKWKDHPEYQADNETLERVDQMLAAISEHAQDVTELKS